MLNKDDALAQIRRAKLSHVRWRAYAQGLVSGVPVDEERVPVKHTDCQFGQWYFSDGLRELGHMETYQQVRGPHEMLHTIYGEIHALVQKNDFTRAHAKVEELVLTSRALLDLIDKLEQEVSALR